MLVGISMLGAQAFSLLSYVYHMKAKALAPKLLTLFLNLMAVKQSMKTWRFRYIF